MTQPSLSTWTIGHDGSDFATRAVDWAARHASGRNVEIVVVRAWESPALDLSLHADPLMDEMPSAVSLGLDAVSAVARASDVPISTGVVRGSATSALLDASEDGELLVVGSRGLGGFRRLLLGSVSSQCATHARVPTIVVPPSTRTDRAMQRIVIGVDGSERSKQAFAWATEFAPEDAEILVVGAWIPSKVGYVAVAQHYTDELQQARDQFHEFLDQQEGESGTRRYERRFVYADPARVLLEEVERSDMVVVGQRGHSGLSAAILGSVTTHLLHHSPIPVGVVPHGD